MNLERKRNKKYDMPESVNVRRKGSLETLTFTQC